MSNPCCNFDPCCPPAGCVGLPCFRPDNFCVEVKTCNQTSVQECCRDSTPCGEVTCCIRQGSTNVDNCLESCVPNRPRRLITSGQSEASGTRRNTIRTGDRQLTNEKTVGTKNMHNLNKYGTGNSTVDACAPRTCFQPAAGNCNPCNPFASCPPVGPGFPFGSCTTPVGGPCCGARPGCPTPGGGNIGDAINDVRNIMCQIQRQFRN